MSRGDKHHGARWWLSQCQGLWSMLVHFSQSSPVAENPLSLTLGVINWLQRLTWQPISTILSREANICCKFLEHGWISFAKSDICFMSKNRSRGRNVTPLKWPRGGAIIDWFSREFFFFVSALGKCNFRFYPLSINFLPGQDQRKLRLCLAPWAAMWEARCSSHSRDPSLLVEGCTNSDTTIIQIAF